jgi:hypothetical protein
MFVEPVGSERKKGRKRSPERRWTSPRTHTEALVYLVQVMPTHFNTLACQMPLVVAQEMK